MYIFIALLLLILGNLGLCGIISVENITNEILFWIILSVTGILLSKK
jgi:hypothetical protein